MLCDAILYYIILYYIILYYIILYIVIIIIRRRHLDQPRERHGGALSGKQTDEQITQLNESSKVTNY